MSGNSPLVRSVKMVMVKIRNASDCRQRTSHSERCDTEVQESDIDRNSSSASLDSVAEVWSTADMSKKA